MLLPRVLANVPAAQFSQMIAPSALNFPTGQGVQDAEPGTLEYVPAKHWLQLAAPLAEKDPAAQFEQVVALAGLYCPALHAVQLAAAAPL